MRENCMWTVLAMMPSLSYYLPQVCSKNSTQILIVVMKLFEESVMSAQLRVVETR
jgi:hypothetical protein